MESFLDLIGYDPEAYYYQAHLELYRVFLQTCIQTGAKPDFFVYDPDAHYWITLKGALQEFTRKKLFPITPQDAAELSKKTPFPYETILIALTKDHIP